jgi:hypothetical protein
MKDTTGTVGLLKPLLMAGLLLHVSVCQSTAAAAANAHEVTVPVLRVGADYFTNAAVTAQSATRVTVIHSRGMLMAKMADLDPDVRRQLGFDPGPAKGSNGTATSAAGTNATVLGKLKTMGDGFLAGVAQAQADRETKGAPLFRALSEIGKRAEQEAKNSSDRFENPSWVQELVGFLILGLVFLLYVLFCKACGHLCRRAGSPSQILVWLPGFKRLALYRATGTSWWWFFIGIVPVFGQLIAAIAWIVCCVRLCDTFQLSRWWVWLMILPGINWLVFMHFATATKAEDRDPAIRSLTSSYAS